MVDYKLELKVPAVLVATIFDLLKDEGVVVSIEPIEGKQRKQRHPYVGGVKDKGITGYELVLKLLADGARWSVREISAAFQKQGFASNSCNSVISKLKRDGKILDVGPSTYQLKK